MTANRISVEAEGFIYLDLFNLGGAASKDSANKSTAILCFNDDMAFGMLRSSKAGNKSSGGCFHHGNRRPVYQERYEPKLTNSNLSGTAGR